jgi:signal transduction histidine kinase
MTVESYLRKVPFLRDLTEEALRDLTRLGTTRTARADEILFREGDPGDTLYVVLSGAVAVQSVDEQGEAVELARLNTGAFFGELALIDAEPRSATGVVVEESELFMLGRTAFLGLLDRAHPMLKDLLAGLSAKIRNSNVQYFEMRLQKERLRAQAEIERHRSISQMVAGVAHEINTPLGIVNNAASLITEMITPKTIPTLAKDARAEDILTDMLDAATLIQSNIVRAGRLVESFKNLSVRNLTGRKEAMDFGALTEEAVGLYRLKARQSRLRLEVVDELGETDRTWEGFPGHYTQVILNLMTNIDRYAYPNGRGGVVRVTVSQEADAGKASRFGVVVEDFGRGIPKKDLPKVFDAFFTTERTIGGTGLGLAIVHNLVTSALQGTISIASEPDQGTRVVMRLPKTVEDEP